MARFLKALIILVPVGAGVLFFFTRTLYGIALVSSWNSGADGCSAGQIVRGFHQATRLVEDKRRFRAEFKKVAEDGRFQQWSTSLGAFWYGWTPGDLDALVLAESADDQYGTHRIRPGDVVMDCGSNVGTFCRRALDRGAGKVIALEINPISRGALQRTFVKEIAEGRLIVYEAGVWDSDTELDLTLDSVVLARVGDKVRVRVKPMDAIARELGLARVDFIKMDIEGAEKPALRGAAKLLATHLPELAIAAEHLEDDQQAIPALVKQLSGGRYRTASPACMLQSGYKSEAPILWYTGRQ